MANPESASARAETDADAAAAATAARRTASNVEDTKLGTQHDVHGDEALKVIMTSLAGLLAANGKRTYDEYQDLSLERARIANERARSDLSFLEEVRIRRLQSADNLISEAHRVNGQTDENLSALFKQHLAHRDIATDRTWNIDEVAAYVEKILQNMGIDSSVIAKVLAEMAQTKTA